MAVIVTHAYRTHWKQFNQYKKWKFSEIVYELVISCINSLQIHPHSELIMLQSSTLINFQCHILLHKLYWLINKKENLKHADHQVMCPSRKGVASVCGGQGKSRCWCIFFLPTWQNSEGARQNRKRERGRIFWWVDHPVFTHNASPVLLLAERQCRQSRWGELPLSVSAHLQHEGQDHMPGPMRGETAHTGDCPRPDTWYSSQLQEILTLNMEFDITSDLTSDSHLKKAEGILQGLCCSKGHSMDRQEGKTSREASPIRDSQGRQSSSVWLTWVVLISVFMTTLARDNEIWSSCRQNMEAPRWPFKHLLIYQVIIVFTIFNSDTTCYCSSFITYSTSDVSAAVS